MQCVCFYYRHHPLRPPLAPARLLRSCRARVPLAPSDPFPRTRSPRDISPDRRRRSPVQPAVASAPGRRLAARTLDGNSPVAAAGDPSPRPRPPRPDRAPPPHTHRGAPSRVPGADARPTLTAAATAAAGWSSSPPSPTARGRPAEPQPPPPPLPPPPRPPRPRRPPPPRPRPRASRRAAARPPRPSPLARARRGRGSAAAAGGGGCGLPRSGGGLSAEPQPAGWPARGRRCFRPARRLAARAERTSALSHLRTRVAPGSFLEERSTFLTRYFFDHFAPPAPTPSTKTRAVEATRNPRLAPFPKYKLYLETSQLPCPRCT